ncbi:bifunctional dTDP-4-dehydrorhamnose 3,5-epimerase family protein/NAD(P)-dependent oxidoreductase [Pseudarthrobacter sp. J75]|uniref:bifunctional dTDP-4-dehydrorhamnose 3,5-epimerase family protein/NAD(P)-dependent oxidoreductase n=1 Tax=unclassified Pseudarthrobacter TaxID=2647000 RepID=UPI002E809604|nr:MULTISPECIES: bifunctional dTDP-4-dehydrorhamnose 3,5-epimerase family protein/NAD(P)-dependent oxidoreductase [unclassified Pseudarthrobacter]MEE2521404.1 bifunctional dTDP-4-dehydrorhamnose 3,5-epimerase family protein/NAD(P)-dependent oxidoreductase [Pseudarthrobacter sp. J47]MEE2528636.1 bifunctional dTDP-4-dehydrorhamnose 3,5-epimerase family protein/NAD(P)-dependent oxidoreductase [Pseudarthrobacter sp. J75]MEE2568327.1 bifunctional dTDP-4-dehydrorhamnose 3,5-epimerase family protein/NA
MTIDFSKPLAARETPIPGVILFDLPVHGDNRGWFKENWQREKMLAMGLPDFKPVQNNISFNEKAGTTRGIHAEPWDKFISVATGSIFGAWVDLREGPSFGAVFTAVMDASQAIFVPRGVGNAFQTLEDNTAYTYLVNDHWSAGAQGQYTFLNLADETAAIAWPIPLEDAELSDKDKAHPRLADVAPMPGKKTLVLGANGQLGKALREAYDGDPSVDFASRETFDLTSRDAGADVNWKNYSTIINAAAYTAVDAAETLEGRQMAWNVNVTAVARVARIAVDNDLTLVHVSSDYVFDGSAESHDEDEAFSPLGVYGQTKAAGDAIISVVPKHYIVRTSWVIGDGNNFVRTMASLAGRGIAPSVVNDQVGRLSFTEDIAAAIRHLLDTKAAYGTYNVSNDGEPQTWADIAADVYELAGASRDQVTGVSTEEYFKGKDAAPRPLNSALDLSKIKAAGFSPAPAAQRLREYLAI